jgi:hypothetical protein
MPTTIDALKKLGLVAIVGSVIGAPALALGFWLMTTVGILPSDEIGNSGFAVALALVAISVGIAFDRVDNARNQQHTRSRSPADGVGLGGKDAPAIRATYFKVAGALIVVSVVVIPIVTYGAFS